MTAISDGVVIGVVLSLIFAAVCYYLYSRVNQLERKVGLMENILLDLKVAQQSLFTGGDPISDQMPDSSSSNHEEFHQYREVIAEANAEANEEYRPPTPIRSSDPQEMREVPLDSTPRSRSPQQSLTITREGGESSSVQEQLASGASSQSSVSVNYESMTYKELTTLAKTMGISGLRNQSKAFVIDAIRRHISGKGPASPSTDAEPSGLTNWTKSSMQFEEDKATDTNTFQTLDQVGNMELSSAQEVSFGGTAIEETNVASLMEMVE